MVNREMSADFDSRDIAAVVGLVNGRWVWAIPEEVTADAKRHRELLAAIVAISEEALTETLRRMERGGLVERKVEPGVSAHVIYRPTELARRLDEPLGALFDWRSADWASVELARCRWSGR
jgi:DNA-binding HxlR family transcriptional regulator